MSLEVKVPAVGESIAEVTIARWLKKDGDMVERDELLCELESDKATFELNAEASGRLKIIVQTGESAEIGTIICHIDTEAAAVAAPAEKEVKVVPIRLPQTASEIVEMKVPAVGESINEVTISSWLKGDGDIVQLDEPIAEIESDKATFELTAKASGKLRVIAKVGETIEIGALICKIEVLGGAVAATASSAASLAVTTSEGGSYAAGHAAPAAAKILAEKGLASGDVKGTGVAGRITKEDALKAEKLAASSQGARQAASAAAQSSAPVIAGGGAREQKREKMSSIRKTISRRLVAVKNETAMLTTFNEVNMAPIMALRSKYKESFKEKYEVGLGFMSFFTKAVCVALEEWPAVNAQIDGEEIVYSNYCDVSVAVSTPRGLVVPVIRNAGLLSFDQIEKEIVRLAVKARDGKLSIEEMQGGTFTITNGGIFGSMLSTPIINAPQSAILGMHNIVERPVVENGQIVIRPVMYVALSYDHRIIDGRGVGELSGESKTTARRPCPAASWCVTIVIL